MTPEQRRLVQASWPRIAPHADAVAVAFYDRLFTLDPSLRALFRGSMDSQRDKLMQALTVVVRGLDRLDSIVPVLEGIGRRHADYGVMDAHYGTVGAALLWTLEQGLGDDFTPELRDAWTAAYGLIAGTMQRAAAESVAA